MSVLVSRRSMASGHAGSAPATPPHRGPLPPQRAAEVDEAPPAPWRPAEAAPPDQEYHNAGPDVYWSASPAERGAA